MKRTLTFFAEYFTINKSDTDNIEDSIGVWLSLVEYFVRDEGVACSNHVTPIPWQGHWNAWYVSVPVFFFINYYCLLGAYGL